MPLLYTSCGRGTHSWRKLSNAREEARMVPRKLGLLLLLQIKSIKPSCAPQNVVKCHFET